MIEMNRTLDLEEVDLHRLENCKSYEDCLTACSKKRVESFSCMGCKGYELDPEFKIEPVAEIIELVYPGVSGSYAIGKEFKKQMGAALKKVGVKEFDAGYRIPWNKGAKK